MKWKDDRYKNLKYEVYEIIRLGLENCDAEKITLRHLTDSIDEFFDKLTDQNLSNIQRD